VAAFQEVDGDWLLEADNLLVTGFDERLGRRLNAIDGEERWEFSVSDEAATGVSSASLRSLVGRKISKAVALASGELRLEVSGAEVLSFGPREGVEAWQIRRDGESVLIAGPTGRGLIVF